MALIFDSLGAQPYAADVIAKQEAVGLASITDGEYRRTAWNIDFLEHLDNVESYAGERKVKFSTSGAQPRQVLVVVSQTGLVPEHWLFDVQPTQTPAVALHTGVEPPHLVEFASEH